MQYLCKALDWDLPAAAGYALEPPAAVPPNRHVFPGALVANGNGKSHAFASGARASSAGVPAQTPLVLPQPPTRDRGQKRASSSWFGGTTKFGSGVGARLSLDDASPIAPPPTGATEAGSGTPGCPGVRPVVPARKAGASSS